LVIFNKRSTLVCSGSLYLRCTRDTPGHLGRGRSSRSCLAHQQVTAPPPLRITRAIATLVRSNDQRGCLEGGDFKSWRGAPVPRVTTPSARGAGHDYSVRSAIIGSIREAWWARITLAVATTAALSNAAPTNMTGS